MLDRDVVAERQRDGVYRIRRWHASDGRLLPIPGHEDLYDEEEMYRRLNQLRWTGDTKCGRVHGCCVLSNPENR